MRAAAFHITLLLHPSILLLIGSHFSSLATARTNIDRKTKLNFCSSSTKCFIRYLADDNRVFFHSFVSPCARRFVFCILELISYSDKLTLERA